MYKYKFKNASEFWLKTTYNYAGMVTKLLRSTWVMFNVTRMVFLFPLLPGQSYLKCVYSLLVQFLRLFGYAKRSKTFSLNLSPSRITPPRVHVVNSCHVCAKFYFKKKNLLYPFIPCAYRASYVGRGLSIRCAPV